MKVLLTMYFRRSVSVEGGGTLLHSLADSLLRAGHEPTVCAPYRSVPAVDYAVRPVPCDQGTVSPGAYRRVVESSLAGHDLLWMHENNPAFAFLAHRIRRPLGLRFWVTFGAPAQTWRDLAGRRLSGQYLAHNLAKHEFWSRRQSYVADRYVVSTQFQAEQLVAAGAPHDRVDVVPLGVTPTRCPVVSPVLARRRLGLPEGRPIAAYLGHLSPIKGVEDLIRAVAILAGEEPELLLALAWSGKGSRADAVRARIRAAGLAGRIRLFGLVDVGDFLAAADVTVLPYTHGSVPHYPLVLAESLAAGTPVVTTRVGGLAEGILEGETGCVVPPADPTALADAIRRVLRSGGAWRAAARKDFEDRFSTDVAVARLPFDR